MLVICIIDDIFCSVIGEQRVLACLVVVKIGMLMLADVVGREIGKDADLELNAVNSCHL